MAKNVSHRNPAIHVCLAMLGSASALARAMDVNPSSVKRWVDGVQELKGAPHRLALAIMAHPDEYMRFKKAQQDADG